METSCNVMIKAHAVADYSGGKKKAALAVLSRRLQDSQSNKTFGIVNFLILANYQFTFFSVTLRVRPTMAMHAKVLQNMTK